MTPSLAYTLQNIGVKTGHGTVTRNGGRRHGEGEGDGVDEAGDEGRHGGKGSDVRRWT